jgi:hypothetical protein
MCLLLILFWCSAVVRRCGGPKILADNSWFGEFNSLLGRREFPFAVLREFARKGLIYLAVFAARRRVLGKIDEIPGLSGKTGNFASPAERAVGATQIVSTNIPTEGWIGGLGTEMAMLNQYPERAYPRKSSFLITRTITPARPTASTRSPLSSPGSITRAHRASWSTG